MDEDISLSNTWLKVSRDATVGGDQSRDAYWIRMKEHFDVHNTSGIDCTERSLRSRWSTINKDCQRWALEEKKLAMEERSRLLEWEKYLFFMDTSTFDDRQKDFINLS